MPKCKQNHLGEIMVAVVMPGVREAVNAGAVELAARRDAAPDVFDEDQAAHDILVRIVELLWDCTVDEEDEPSVLSRYQLSDRHLRAAFKVAEGQGE